MTVLYDPTPRVRGEEISGLAAVDKIGITPACAGRRPVPLGCWIFPRDHPRVCGEKQSVGLNPLTKPGSPPRVRGEGGHAGINGTWTGITPACAGRRFLYIYYKPVL